MWGFVPLPTPSMYGIFVYIWLICMVNVGNYTIHGSYGLDSHVFTEPVLTRRTTPRYHHDNPVGASPSLRWRRNHERCSPTFGHDDAETPGGPKQEMYGNVLSSQIIWVSYNIYTWFNKVRLFLRVFYVLFLFLEVLKIKFA